MRKSFYCGKYDVWCSKDDKPFLKCMEYDMLDRLGDWQKFSRQMEKHIKEYTIPQYASENGMEDRATIYSSKDCVKAIEKYLSRFGKNARGTKEALRDMLKIAHYAQFAYDNLKLELDEKDVYLEGD